MRYKITLTKEQYNHIAQCVETCHRIACGQIEELRSILPNTPDDSLLRELKHEAFPELYPDESYGWNGGYRGTERGEPFRKAFDKFQAQGYQIYRQMYHIRNIAEGIDNVYSSLLLRQTKQNNL